MMHLILDNVDYRISLPHCQSDSSYGCGSFKKLPWIMSISPESVKKISRSNQKLWSSKGSANVLETYTKCRKKDSV